MSGRSWGDEGRPHSADEEEVPRSVDALLLRLDPVAVRVMLVLEKHPMTVGQASRASGIGRTATRNRLRDLAALGLAQSSRRARLHIFSLTSAGRATLDAVEPALMGFEVCSLAARLAEDDAVEA